MTAIRPGRSHDAGAIAGIYRHYVEQTAVSFEEVAPDAAEMAARIAAAADPHAWLVAEDPDGRIAGYAYSRPFHPRAAYRFTCETSIYLAHERRGTGIARPLYTALIDLLAGRGFVSAIALITIPNAESTGFHERMGFLPAGRLTEVGFKHGAWRDVGYWQRDLAPRSLSPT